MRKTDRSERESTTYRFPSRQAEVNKERVPQGTGHTSEIAEKLIFL